MSRISDNNNRDRSNISVLQECENVAKRGTGVQLKAKSTTEDEGKKTMILDLVTLLRKEWLWSYKDP